jgi:hypothetical protein
VLSRATAGSLGVTRPSLRLGVLVAVLTVAAATGAIYPLKLVAPVVSLSVVYLPAVLIVSAYWGLAIGLFTSLLLRAHIANLRRKVERDDDPARPRYIRTDPGVGYRFVG